MKKVKEKTKYYFCGTSHGKPIISIVDWEVITFNNPKAAKAICNLLNYYSNSTQYEVEFVYTTCYIIIAHIPDITFIK